MLNRLELDTMNMEQELAALGKCHKYYPTLECVNGENIE